MTEILKLSFSKTLMTAFLGTAMVISLVAPAYAANNTKQAEAANDAEHVYDNDGNRLTGWRTQNGNRVYYSSDSEEKETGWVVWHNTKYHTDKKGVKQTGWVEDNGKKYYFDSNGQMTTGITKINGDTYYFGDDGAMLTGLQTVSNNSYYFDTDGKMKTGWVDINGNKYYFNADGTMQTSKSTIDGQYAFFEKSGEYKGSLFTGIDSVSDTSVITPFGGYTLSADVQQNLINAANVVITGTGSDVGFVMIDVNTQKGFAYNIDRTFYSASTIKAPYVTSLLTENPNVINTDKEAIRKTIVYSSNDDYLALRRKYGRASLDKYLQKANLRSDICDNYYSYLTTRELAKLWLCNWEYFDKNTQATELMSWFQNVETSAIKPVLGNSKTTLSKAGWLTGGTTPTTNDAGIVYDGDSPYILCIMTNMSSNGTASFSKLHNLVSAIDNAHKEIN